jgi:hypothetical protein
MHTKQSSWKWEESLYFKQSATFWTVHTLADPFFPSILMDFLSEIILPSISYQVEWHKNNNYSSLLSWDEKSFGLDVVSFSCIQLPILSINEREEYPWDGHSKQSLMLISLMTNRVMNNAKDDKIERLLESGRPGE